MRKSVTSEKFKVIQILKNQLHNENATKATKCVKRIINPQHSNEISTDQTFGVDIRKTPLYLRNVFTYP